VSQDEQRAVPPAREREGGREGERDRESFICNSSLSGGYSVSLGTGFAAKFHTQSKKA